MPAEKTGQTFVCPYCSNSYYRARALVRLGRTITCGKRECVSESRKGDRNHFHGRSHTEEAKKRISRSKALNPTLGRTGPPKGFRHSPEARAKIAEASRKLWAEKRDQMMAALPRGPEKPREELRYRRNFYRWQRAEWGTGECLWCHSTEDLVLDHIIPVQCGGTNERKNAQTLCRTCNLWKAVHVDAALFRAGLGNSGG